MDEIARRVGRRDVLRGLGAAGVAGLAGCAGDGGDATTTESDGTTTGTGETTTDDGGMDEVTAAWLYISEVGDLGWSHAHDQGRQATEEAFDWLETTYNEAVDPSNSTRVLKEYARQDVDVIFGTTFGYMDPMVSVAEENPDIIFEHCSGYKTRENMGRYFGKIYEPRYLLGQAAGMVTEADTLGYVGAFPIPEVVRSINAFQLGVESVNPEATTKVRWVNAWFDPPSSKEAANSLIDEGVDVLVQEQDSPAAVKAANEAGVWASGYNAPMGEFGGENYLVSPVWNWEEFYKPTLQSVKDGTWESDAFWGGMETNVPTLDEWGPNVPQDVKDQVSSTEQEIVGGDIDIWADSKFAGEDATFLFQEMQSFVEGVEGTVPES